MHNLMKKLFITTAMILALGACSSPQQAQLTIAPQPVISPTPLVKSTPLMLGSRDLRTAQFVAVVDNGREEVIPLHATTNLRISLEEALSRQLISQGFQMVSKSHTKLRLDLLDALVKVKHSMFSHQITTSVQIQLVAQNNADSFVKRYTGSATQKGAMSASPEDMEKELNSLLEAVLKDMANDKQLIKFMSENA